jgi:hypothetical protein
MSSYHTTHSIVKSFMTSNPTLMAEKQFKHKRKTRTLLAEVLDFYFSLVAEDLLTKGYVLEMGYGLGKIYLAAHKVPDRGHVPLRRNVFKKDTEELEVFDTKEEYMLKYREFYDQSGYHFFKLKWKKERLKNVRSYQILGCKSFKKQIAHCVNNRTLMHY